MMPKFNLDILMHRSAAGGSLNNLITLFHLVEKEGSYEGLVFLNDRLSYNFILECDKESRNEFLQIDLSMFDALHANSLKKQHYRHPVFHIRPAGVLLFYVSGRHNNFSLSIRNRKKEKEFDSRHLGKNDKAAVRLFNYGKYELKNRLNNHKTIIEVVKKSDNPNDRSIPRPVNMKYTSKGFEKNSIRLNAGQLLVIDSSSDISVAVDMRKDGK